MMIVKQPNYLYSCYDTFHMLTKLAEVFEVYKDDLVTETEQITNIKSEVIKERAVGEFLEYAKGYIKL